MQNNSRFSFISISSLAPVLISGLALVLVVFFLYPTVKTTLRLRSNLTELTNELEQDVLPKETFLQSLNVNSLTSDLQQIVLLLPNETQPPLFLATLETIAGKNQLALSSLQYQKENAAIRAPKPQAKTDTGTETAAPVVNKPRTVRLSFLVEGDQSKIITFLRDLKTTAPLVDVTSISIEAKGEDEQKVVGSVASRWFVSALPRSLGAITDKIEKLTQKERQALSQASKYKTLLTVEENTASLSTDHVELGKDNPF